MAETRRKEKDPARITLTNVRLSHPHVFTARTFGKGRGGEAAKPAFSATALIEIKREVLIDKIWDAVDAAKEKAFPGKDVRDIKIKKANMALFEGSNPGEDVEIKEEQKGMLVVRARTYKRPMVLDADGEELRESDNVIYGGCYVDMIVQFWAQDYEGTKRLNCSLEGIRFRDDGDPFGAGPLDPSEFDEGVDDGGDRGGRSSRSRDRDEDDRGGRSRSRDDDEDRGSRRGRDDDDRGSRRGRDDDEDKGTSRRRGDDDDDRGSRRGGRDAEDDDRGSSRRRGRDEDEDRGSSRRRGDDDDERGTSRRRGDDDDDRGSRRGKDDDDRGSSRRGRDDDEDRGSSRRRGDDDDDRGSRRGRDDDDRGSRRGRDDDDDRGSRRRGREDLS